MLAGLLAAAVTALADPDVWGAFAGFFATLADAMRTHAGLSERLDARGGPRVAQARALLMEAVRCLCGSAHAAGLRADVGWRDVVFLAGIAGGRTCALGMPPEEGQPAMAMRVILAGLRPASP